LKVWGGNGGALIARFPCRDAPGQRGESKGNKKGVYNEGDLKEQWEEETMNPSS